MRPYLGRRLCGIKCLELSGSSGETEIQNFFMPQLAKDAERTGLWGCKIRKGCGRRNKGGLRA